MRAEAVCYCGNKEECRCISILSGQETALTPEQLMRSRYVAFALANVEYLIDSSSTALKKTLNKAELSHYCQTTKFIGLEILNAYDNKVEFKAKLLDKDTFYVLHEVSEFLIESNQWKYDSGELIETPSIRIKRNDPCPCGSGKKFKKCHA